MTKIINTVTGETIANITTNHSITLDEAIDLVGEHITPNPETNDFEDVKINDELYFYEDLDLIAE